jgi:N-acetylglucosaminyldiphosphoundecaprenol N-acetyl-beta-D-mannosaminyltransferase
MTAVATPRFNVLGVGVHALNLESATAVLLNAAAEKSRRYVCCCDAHSISCARRSASHRHVLNRAFLATPDGMLLVWLGRLAGHREVGRVYGPDLLDAVCAATAGTGHTHFFYGGAPGVATALAERMIERYPSLAIVGSHSPPLVDDVADLPLNAITIARPDFVWVGLGTPKQEAFMHRLAESETDFGTALGVGAAFDFLTGRIRQAPRAIQRSGLEWLWRTTQEPARLTERYLRTAPLFAALSLAQILHLRDYPVED